MTKALKIGPLKDRTPIKLNLLLDPDLHADLEDYAAIHTQAFGKRVSPADIAPFMLQALIESDAGFKRARRQLKSNEER